MSNDEANAPGPDSTSVNPAFAFSTMVPYPPTDPISVAHSSRTSRRPRPGVNALVNGAYSVIPGVYNAGRAVARGTGLLGAEEFRRFGQEAEAIGAGLGRLAQRPELAVRAGRAAWPVLRDNPRTWPYLVGRGAMGAITHLGPAAMVGDALRAIENGHNFGDAFFYRGLQGNPPRNPR